jgi:hypothetical protein
LGCLGFVVVSGSVVLALRDGEGGMAVIRCEEFKVACAPDDGSCEECVLRLRAAEREEARARVEARRRVLLGRAEEGSSKSGQRNDVTPRPVVVSGDTGKARGFLLARNRNASPPPPCGKGNQTVEPSP